MPAKLTQADQAKAATIVDLVTEAVAEAVREELDDLRAQITQLRMEMRHMAAPKAGALAQSSPVRGVDKVA
jgi:hypothetical protein